MTTELDQAIIPLQRGRDKPVRRKHPWIFSGSIQHIPDEVADGAIVSVEDASGEWLARGYLNRNSQIQIRILSWQRNEIIDEAFWRRKLDAAIQLRAPLEQQTATNAYRLVNGESDYLPGLIVDRYADYLVLQAGTLGIDRRKEMLAHLLLDLTGCAGVWERSDVSVRRAEGLDEIDGQLAGAPVPRTVQIKENDLRFDVDIHSGQKTGFYLDQRENRHRVAAYCVGARVLNGFSYTGGFTVYALAAGAEHVTNVDSSMEALELGETNLRHNGFDPDAQAASIAGDVFEVLRDWLDPARTNELFDEETFGEQFFDDTVLDDRRFDVIILDPPKFATTRQSVERALRGYKDINMLALRLLRPGGILATFSCSGAVDADLFQKMLFGACVDAGRDVQILEWLHQVWDHPVALTFPEGTYLKGLICRVL